MLPPACLQVLAWLRVLALLDDLLGRLLLHLDGLRCSLLAKVDLHEVSGQNGDDLVLESEVAGPLLLDVGVQISEVLVVAVVAHK